MEKLSKNRNIIVLCNSNTDNNLDIIKNLLSKYLNDEKFFEDNISFLIFNYRKISINGEENYLLNSPGNNDFKTIEQVLSNIVDGIIILIETHAGLEDTDLEIMDLIRMKNIPQILMANRNDLEDIERTISVEGILMIPTIIKEEIGVDSGLKMLLKLIEKKDKKNEELNNDNNDLNENKNFDKIGNHKEEKKLDKSGNHNEDKKFDDHNDYNKNISIYAPNKPETKNSEFCKVRLFFHPIELDNVKKSLGKFGFSNLTIIDIKYRDPQIDKTETYRCSSYDMELPPKIELNMVIRKEEIEYVVRAIESVKTEDISEKIFLSPVEDVIRIRTTERGESAVD